MRRRLARRSLQSGCTMGRKSTDIRNTRDTEWKWHTVYTVYKLYTYILYIRNVRERKARPTKSGKNSSVKSRGWINEYSRANNTTRFSSARGIDLYYFHEHPRHDLFFGLFATTGEVFFYTEGVNSSLYRTRKARIYHWTVAAKRYSSW